MMLGPKDPFVYHKPTPEQVERMGRINDAIRAAYQAILADVPASAERTLAIRKLQEARMWGNCAIVLEEEG